MPDDTTICTHSPIQAAQVVADLAEAYWETLDLGLPPVLTTLVPAVSPTTGNDALPAAYAIPSAIKFERHNAHVATQTTTVTLAIAVETYPGSAAHSLLEMFRDTAAYILSHAPAVAAATGYHIPDADISEPFDPELLRLHGIFHATMDVTVVSHPDL